MKTIAEEDFTNNFFDLLAETFEGPPEGSGSSYLEHGGGLFQTLDRVTAETASTPGRPGGPTIAAHTEHLRFYVMVHEGLLRGASERIDWDKSWVVQSVTPQEWDQLKERLRAAYVSINDQLKSIPAWKDTEVGCGMAILTHSAYHLGAIRQIMQALAQRTGAEHMPATA